MKEGAILDVQAPGGQFYLDTRAESPVVLVSGGVGITPMLSMLNDIVRSGSRRETWFFFGATNRSEHIQHDHLARVAAENRNVHLVFADSQPSPGSRPGVDYHVAGRVTIDLLREKLPSPNYDVFLCGPPPMMQTLIPALETWGVPKERIHFEAFGAATVKKAAVAVASPAGPSTRSEVVFERSGKKAAWNEKSASLLELAEAAGVAIDSGCRAGSCGTCVVAVKEGEVAYSTEPGFRPSPGTCLACVGIPKSETVVLDS